jgi:outer membrane protein OmpA-like peptidoglycan-associated protein
MLLRALSIGVAVLAMTMPAAAQQRGTVEFGGFASHTAFDGRLGINDSWGAGGRVGAFLFPQLSVEFEAGGGTASRTLGRRSVNVGDFSARRTGVPFRSGRVSVLLGAGVGHTDTHFLESDGDHGNGTSNGQSYGYHGLVGGKLALSDRVALRADWIQSFMANGGDRNRSLHLGMSVYRHPLGTMTTVFRTMPAPPVVHRMDSVSAAETQRLRGVEVSYRALRDSLATPRPASSAAALATMRERIYFAHDRSDLSDAAKAILRDKVPVFRANPAMRIIIVGFASKPGTAAYNMELGLRRAEAAKAYLVSQNIDPIRIEIATRGAGQLLVEGPGETADAANRRAEFRLQVADPHLMPPMR